MAKIVRVQDDLQSSLDSMKHTYRWAFPILLGLMGCGEAPQSRGEIHAMSREDIRIFIITHGQASDPFWSVVRNGADAAGHDMGVRVMY